MTIYHALLLAASLLAALGQILFKLGAEGAHSLSDYINLYIIGGLAAYGLGMLIWIFTLSKVPLSIVYAFTALTFCAVYLASFFLLKEAMPIRSWVGLGMILSGFFLLAR